MRFLHLADLHLGKKINEYPLYDDQRHVLLQALDLAKKERVDAVLAAGDIYDSSLPTAEAMDFYDWFLSSFHELGKPMFLISGNHDSAERLHVASSILKKNSIFISTSVMDFIHPEVLGDTCIYSLPFFRPSDVNRAFGSDARTYGEAMEVLLSQIELDQGKNNILLAHQAFLPSSKKIEGSGSETSLTVGLDGYVGGTEAIPVELLKDFDYVALGHIHKSQNIASNARYAGALLKYHIDEANTKRSISIVEIEDKKLSLEEYEVNFLHDLVILNGTLNEIMEMEGHENDYVYAKLLDESFVDAPMAKLKAKYPLCLGLEYPSLKGINVERPDYEDVEEVDKNVLFANFFQQYGGRDLNERETEFVKRLLDEEEGK